MVHAFAQLIITAFAVGLMIGACITRVSRNLLSGATALPGDWETPVDLDAGAPRPLGVTVPLREPVRTKTTGSDGAEFYIVEEAAGLARIETYNFGACHSSQRNSLDEEGFIFGGADGPTGHDGIERGCAVSGLTRTVVVLTPMHNRAHMSKGEMAIDRYFRLLATLTYPKNLTSVALLVGDSTDNTYGEALARMEGLRGKGYRRLMILTKNFGDAAAAQVPAEERHKYHHQLERRIHLARVRNWLAVTALRDEEWAMWLDADLWSYPPDLVQFVPPTMHDCNLAYSSYIICARTRCSN